MLAEYSCKLHNRTPARPFENPTSPLYCPSVPEKKKEGIRDKGYVPPVLIYYLLTLQGLIPV